MAHLSQSDAEWILQTIKQKLGGNLKACVECGHNNFSMQNEVAFLPQIQLMAPGEENNIELGSGLALAAVSCANCGNTRLFNVNSLGFRPGAGY